MANRSESLNSVIGPGSIFEGKFYISGSLRIDGKFQGEIKTEDELVVGETGKVKTNIKARSVVIAGTMIGNIQATEEVRLEKNGKLLGDVETPILYLTPGVIAKGMMTITGGQKKDVEKLIEESFGEGLQAEGKEKASQKEEKKK
ncbi:MAG: polymer-forming cytoskeletal protein [Leptospiraceae bacterium]|jgi:cytoskeletal protein CcmA (bactofilin family)|nr:polymer-forming cytoskeletal protein [Leptospiraceae bacterium]